MAYLKMKTVMPSDGATCKLKILDVGGSEENQWGATQYKYEVLLDDKHEMIWQASETAQRNLEEISCDRIDSIVHVKRWDKNGKTGFNYFLDGDVNIQPQNLPQPTPTAQVAQKATPDEYQKKMSRGASLNLATQYELYVACGGKVDMNGWLRNVLANAEKITAKQSAFVNEEEIVIEKEKEMPKEDLPF